MMDKNILKEIGALKDEGGKVMVDCYDPDCPFGINQKPGELPVEIKYSEDSGCFVASCVAYDYLGEHCDVPRMVLNDLELELGEE